MSEFQWYFNDELTKPETYCEALQHLLDEHPLFRKQMESFYYTACLLAYDPIREDRLELLKQLKHQLEVFHYNIEPHSMKEEEYLYQMIKKYFGKDTGPLEIMKQEHKTVKEKIELFLEKYTTVSANSPEDIRDLTNLVSNVFHTLTDHYLKEEEILFPLAENLLSIEEKEMLLDMYRKIKTA